MLTHHHCSAVTGFVRSYGKYLPEEKITMNSVNPNVIRKFVVPDGSCLAVDVFSCFAKFRQSHLKSSGTNISSGSFYDKLEEEKLLTPIEGVVETFEKLLGSDDTSGECFEVGPNYQTQGAVPKKAPEFLDQESEKIHDLLYQRGRALHQPR
jgi:hypothetical protein